MFYNAGSFNGDLSKWKVSGVTNMRCVCLARGEQRGADACWVCGCADTPPPFSFVCCRVRSSMFNDASSFNGDISKWDVSGVDHMGWVSPSDRGVFGGASSFNGDISKWEVSGVTDMTCVCVARGEQRGADA